MSLFDTFDPHSEEILKPLIHPVDGKAWDARTWGAVPVSGCGKYLRVALEAASKL